MREQILLSFSRRELKAVARARAQAEALIGGFYVLAPREWERMHYEVCTLDQLTPDEITHAAFAEVRCYDLTRRSGPAHYDRRDLYRICLQDHRILRALELASARRQLALEPFLLYVLTHELIHVVRFTQQMQQIDLEPELRWQEELSVEQTTRQVLAPVKCSTLRRVIEQFAEAESFVS